MKASNNSALYTFLKKGIQENNTNAKTIAIIGGGFTGALTAIHLLQANFPLSISLIERRPEVGQGIAYSTDISTHLLNVPAGKMSAFPEQPEHFLNWLRARNPLQQPVLSPLNAATFVPRMVYGDYIQSVLSQAIADAPAQVSFHRITDEAVAIESAGAEGGIVYLSSGEALYADQVVLATGNYPASLPFSTQSLHQPERNVKAAWSWDAIAGLQPHDPVLLVGTGLTMVDVVIALHQQGHRGQIYAVSRHGLLPQPHVLNSHSVSMNLETLPHTVRGLLRRVRQEIDLTQDWQNVIDALRPITQKIWQSLPLAEQQRFMRHLKSYWETHRHRVAPEVADLLAELSQSGQLQYYAGRIQACEQREAGIDIILRQRGTTENIALSVQRIINCTGSNCNYRQIQHPLITNLQLQQLISPSRLGIGIDTDASGAVIGKNGQSQWLYTLGTTRKGSLWETTAVPELRQQAQDLAQTLLESLSKSAQTSILISPEPQDSPIFRQLFDQASCTYSYLIGSAGDAVLIDPVLEQVERDLQMLQELGLTLRACLETHIHADHITGAAKLRSLTGCQIIVPENAQVIGADAWIRDAEVLQLGTVQIRAIATPGHTDSHMAYLIDQTKLLTGDALFIRGCGRTDFQGGDAGLLYDRVTQRLFALPDQTLIYPGHDYQGRTASSIGEEKRWNPRFAGNRAEFVQRMNSLNLPYPKQMHQALPANQRCGEILEQRESQSVEPESISSENPLAFCGMYI